MSDGSPLVDSLFFVDTVSGPDYLVPASDEAEARRLVASLGVQVLRARPLRKSGILVDGWELPEPPP